jgi:HAD superfamily hydrolase (TIGR01509 family)
MTEVMSLSKKIRPELTTILFDLDGTLIDSEATAAQVVRESFKEWWGIQIDPQDASHITGRTWDSMWSWIEKKYAPPVPREVALKNLVERYRAHLAQDIVEIPGAAQAVRSLQGNFRLGLVSGSHRQEILFALDHLQIRSCFDVIYGAEDYPRSKPAPDGYQKALDTLQVSAESTLIFEDSEAGIQSGRSVGAWVVAIRAANHFGHDQGHAHFSVQDLSEVSAEWIAQLELELKN